MVLGHFEEVEGSESGATRIAAAVPVSSVAMGGEPQNSQTTHPCCLSAAFSILPDGVNPYTYPSIAGSMLLERSVRSACTSFAWVVKTLLLEHVRPHHRLRSVLATACLTGCIDAI